MLLYLSLVTKSNRKPKLKKDFPTTSWTLVLNAAQSATEAEDSLNRLIAIYWPALYAYLTRDRKLSEHDAKDVLQGFLADKVVQQELIGKADRKRGKFRRYLMVALDHYAISIHRRQQSKRRSPGEEALVEMDQLPRAEVMSWPDTHPEHHTAYDLVWAQQTIEEALRRLKEHCLRTDREAHWAIFEERIVRPFWEGEPPERYAKLVHTHGFTSPLQASNALLSVKRMFSRIFREVIRDYIRDESLVRHELDDILQSLRQFGYQGDPGLLALARDEEHDERK